MYLNKTFSFFLHLCNLWNTDNQPQVLMSPTLWKCSLVLWDSVFSSSWHWGHRKCVDVCKRPHGWPAIRKVLATKRHRSYKNKQQQNLWAYYSTKWWQTLHNNLSNLTQSLSKPGISCIFWPLKLSKDVNSKDT